ncbi:unnamed protein product [Schistosoma rodhaini]|nr:unnamed protein product [Schistosoma rodhaini]
MRYSTIFQHLRKPCTLYITHVAKIRLTNISCPNSLSDAEYERVSTKTLELLADSFEQLPERFALNKEYDVEHAYGVLKITFGPQVGTYIINRQAPNKQLWLSSPQSGPKRYDYIPSMRLWIYKHDGKSLHSLLSEEISAIVGGPVEFQT